MYDYQAAVTHVTDGDTVRFLIDQGMYVRSEQAIRLKDVYAPEKSTPEGREARVKVADWVANHLHLSKPWPFHLVTEKDRQTFNRYVGTGTCSTCGESLNEHLRSLGYTNQGTGAPTI